MDAKLFVAMDCTHAKSGGWEETLEVDPDGLEGLEAQPQFYVALASETCASCASLI